MQKIYIKLFVIYEQFKLVDVVTTKKPVNKT